MRREPSVIGGFRPVVKDAGREAFQRYSWAKSKYRLAKEALGMAEEELIAANAERDAMREECQHCGDCSACIG